MASFNGSRYFPIVKVIPLSVLDDEKEKIGNTALGGIVSDAIDSLNDIRLLWERDHDAGALQDGFRKLFYQLEYLGRYCRGDETIKDR